MARIYVDTAELRDLAARTRDRASELRAVTDGTRRDLNHLLSARAAPRLDAARVAHHADQGVRTGGALAGSLEREAGAVRAIAAEVEASQHGSSFGRGMGLAGSLFGASGGAVPAWAFLVGGAVPRPGVAAAGAGVGGLLPGLQALPSPFPWLAGRSLPAAGRTNVLASLTGRLRAAHGMIAGGARGLPGFLRDLGRGAGRLVGMLRRFALDAWGAISRGVSQMLRLVRAGLGAVVAEMAQHWGRTGVQGARAGRWAAARGHALTRWLGERLWGRGGPFYRPPDLTDPELRWMWIEDASKPGGGYWMRGERGWGYIPGYLAGSAATVSPGPDGADPAFTQRLTALLSTAKDLELIRSTYKLTQGELDDAVALLKNGGLTTGAKIPVVGLLVSAADVGVNQHLHGWGDARTMWAQFDATVGLLVTPVPGGGVMWSVSTKVGEYASVGVDWIVQALTGDTPAGHIVRDELDARSPGGSFASLSPDQQVQVASAVSRRYEGWSGLRNFMRDAVRL